MASEKLKILFTTDSYTPNVDGVVVSVKNSSQLLSQRGHDVRIVAPSHNLKNHIEKENSVIVNRFRSVPILAYDKFRVSLPNYVRLKKFVDDFKPDIVHSHTVPAPISVLSLAYAKSNNIPFVSTYHTSFPDILTYISPVKFLKLNKLLDSVLLEAYTLQTRAKGGKSVKKMLGLLKVRYSVFQTQLSRYISKIRSEDGFIKFHRNSDEALTRKVVWKFTKKVFDPSDLVVTPSESIKKEMILHEILPPVEVVSNGIEIDLFKVKTKYNLKNPKLLYVGRLGYEKKAYLLVRALGKLVDAFPTLTLTIVGEGPAKKSLHMLAIRHKVEKNIKFLGYVARKKLPEIYCKHDIFVTGSDMETQGLVILEAMASGLCVVGVNALAIPDNVIDGKTGYLVEKNDWKGFVEKITLILKSPENIEKMGIAARKQAECHNLKQSIDKLEKIYYSLVFKNDKI